MAKQPYRMTKLTEIRPYDKNPRIIPQAAVDAVARSIAAFGFRAPIVVDGNGVILAGHTRYKAAQQLGLTEVPVVWQTDITDIQARGYRIADNKAAEIATWDRDALDAEVRELASVSDAELDAIGLSDWELERILHECEQGIDAVDNALPPMETINVSGTGSRRSVSDAARAAGDAVPATSCAPACGDSAEHPVILQIAFPNSDSADRARDALAAVALEYGGTVR